MPQSLPFAATRCVQNDGRFWGVDVHASQREKAVAIGATDFFSLPPRELIAAIGERTETPLLRPMGGLPWLHGGVDRVYDTVATAGTLEMGVRVLRPHGRS